GLYSRQKIGATRKHRARDQKFTAFNPRIPEPVPHQEIAVGVIQSKQAEATTSEGLQELKKLLLECHDLRNELMSAARTAKRWLSYAKVLSALSRLLILGFMHPAFDKYRDRRQAHCKEIQDQLERCF